MGKSLSERQIQQYEAQGFLAPLRVFPAAQAALYRGKLEELETGRGGSLSHDERRKTHLYLQWVDEIVHHPLILDAVEDLLGADLLLYTLTTWIKEPNTDAFISWHQDSTYFGLSPPEHVTAWVALSPSTIQSGCVEVVPGSHKRGQIPHAQSNTTDNMLRTGQQLEVGADSAVEMLVLQPGEFSLHHTHLFHNSRPNRSDDRRIGLGISYIPARTRCVCKTRLTAMLVRGQDQGYFELERRPAADLEPAGLSRHADSIKRWHQAREELIPLAHGTDGY